MNLSKIKDDIVSHFLGEKFKNYTACIDKILDCTTLSKFTETCGSLPNSFLDELFSTCIIQDDLSGKFTDKEARGIFLRLRTINSNSEFI